MPADELISSWGGLRAPGHERVSADLAGIVDGAALTRGMGRSYGDACLPVAGDAVANCRLADRILEFDPESGRLRAESGLSLEQINRLFLARRWVIPVSPGTQYVTLGGMVAADVHGKNHHVDGCIGNWVDQLRIRLGDGRTVDCSREQHPDLFLATLGGMGLTGHVLEVTLRLRRVPSPWIMGESVRLHDLDALLGELRRSSERWPYTAAWLDCLAGGASFGRGVIIRGRWAETGEAPEKAPRRGYRVSVPFTAPNWLLSRLTLRMFNGAFYRRHPKIPRPRLVDPWSFFYPLDAVRNWQRLYGARGFTQHQCVVPRSAGTAAVAELLQRFVAGGGTSFLTVVKDCGPEGEGLLSFPRPGISVALDIPFSDRTQGLVDSLNEHVLAVGGRIYLAKDAFTRPQDFAAMDPRAGEFLRVRERWDPERRLRSAMSQRLFETERARPEVAA
jgi:FAD/FMN-containing dehydrogenase